MTITIRDGNVDIIRWVSQRLGFSNPILGHLINLTCDSDLRGEGTVFAPFDYILDPDVSWWNSNRSSTQHWYQVDLLSLNIFLKGYRLAMNTSHYSRSWQVKGTNDSSLPVESWTLIDSKKLDTIPDKISNTYSCDNPGSFRFLRFLSNSSNFDNNKYMTISRLYLYGKLTWTSCTAIITPNKQINSMIFLFLVKE